MLNIVDSHQGYKTLKVFQKSDFFLGNFDGSLNQKEYTGGVTISVDFGKFSFFQKAIQGQVLTRNRFFREVLFVTHIEEELNYFSERNFCMPKKLPSFLKFHTSPKWQGRTALIQEKGIKHNMKPAQIVAVMPDQSSIFFREKLFSFFIGLGA